MSSSLVRRLARLGLGPAQRRRLEALAFEDAGHGYDCFGMHPDWVGLALATTRPLYERWFRVVSHGVEHLPASGPVVVAANHSGTLPFDGMMLWADLLRRCNPPRVVRPVGDHFIPELPFVRTFFARVGTVGGSRGNVHALLDRGEWVLIFPEGTGGIGKPFWHRYRLQAWRVGHAELALRHRAVVLPVGIVGAEEQMPQLGSLPFHPFGAPYLPLTFTPVPLPVRYHLHYGLPITLHEEFDPKDAERPQVLRAAADRVRDVVQDLLDRGVREREGIFR